MIDNFAILLSTAMIVFVIVRAVRLSRTTPWFERLPADELRAAARRRGVRRDLRAERAAAVPDAPAPQPAPQAGLRRSVAASPARSGPPRAAPRW